MTDQPTQLRTLADDLLAQAAGAHSGRATQALHAAPRGILTQVVLALMSGQTLSEHENPGEAFLQVLRGRVRLSAGEEQWELSEGDLLAIPQSRHALDALEDAVVVLTLARVMSP